jgi:hypothetical protein
MISRRHAFRLPSFHSRFTVDVKVQFYESDQILRTLKFVLILYLINKAKNRDIFLLSSFFFGK